MGRNSEFKRNVDKFRRQLYRSPDGKLLGVFKGIAESLGFCILWTRVVGVIALCFLAGFFGAHSLVTTALVAGFFYLLLALVMQPPRPAGLRTPADPEDEADAVRSPFSRMRAWSGRSSAADRQAAVSPRVDLAQLDRQLDSLNRRIQRMETIVTDRQYDWDRRMES